MSRLIKKSVDEGSLEGVLITIGLRINHLLFVDDIYVFGKGSLLEWKVFKEALELFCNARSMLSSNHKSQFMEVGLSDEDIFQLNKKFSFEVISIEEGFKYL